MVDEDLDYVQACPPPWHVFPTIRADELVAHLKQGETEWWFDHAWRPFWSALQPEQRARYLAHWQASPAWREALQVFDIEPDFDDAADAAESALHRSEHAEVTATPNKSLLRRIFGSRKGQ